MARSSPRRARPTLGLPMARSRSTRSTPSCPTPAFSTASRFRTDRSPSVRRTPGEVDELDVDDRASARCASRRRRLARSVADIWQVYRDWSAKGAEFLTEPKDHGREIRAYVRDPDGHLIEVGQFVPNPA